MTKKHKSKLVSVILALICAFALWIYIVTVVNPEDSQVITNVPVLFSGEDALYQDNSLVITKGGDSTVTITVYGKRSDVKKLTRDSVSAVVDVSRIRNARDYSMSYDVQFATDLSDVNVERNPSRVSFTVENLATKSVEVKAALVGNISEGYLAQDWQYDFESVLVRGPQSVVDTISYAQVVLNRTDLNKTVTEILPYTLVDVDGNPVDMTMLRCDVEEIEVTLPVVMYREIPLDVSFIDGGGATSADVTCEIEPKTITLAGDSTVLEGINKINLGNIDLSSVDGSVEFVFPIVLENDLINVSGEENATVTVSVHGLETKTAYISNSNFEYLNLPEGYEAAAKTAVLIVTLRGTEDALSQLNSSDLYAQADLAAYSKEGTYTVNVVIKSRKNVKFGVIGSYSISCGITEVPDEPVEPEPEDES